VLHPGQAAEIWRDGTKLGDLGLLHPRIQADLGLNEPVFLFELELDQLLATRLPEFSEFSRFPEIRRDIAILVDRNTPATDIMADIHRNAGDYLQNLKLFDLYMGKGIDPARKSLALGLTFQHSSRNLTDQEISDSIAVVIASLQEKFGARLRN
jgi:phenylalanyl-tRNA synthetase beta chain